MRHMKRTAMIYAIAALMLTACGPSESREVESVPETETAPAVTETSPAESGAESAGTSGSETAEPEPEELPRKEMSFELSYPDRPQTMTVALVGAYKDAQFENQYNINVLHTGVVGLFGCPVKIRTKGLQDAQVIFRYDDNDMNGVSENNLAMLHYDSTHDDYEYCPFTLDTEANTVSAPAGGSGVYLLVDDYAWRSVWGMDTTGLDAPVPQDEYYRFDEPFGGEGFHAAITIPWYANIFSHKENYATDTYTFATFGRMTTKTGLYDPERDIWLDFTLIVPDEPTDLEGFADLMEEHRADLLGENAGHEYKFVDRQTIHSADGTEGVRLIAEVTYFVFSQGEKKPDSTDYTYFDYYPCEDRGYYELRADYIRMSPDAEYGVYPENAESVLAGFTILE